MLPVSAWATSPNVLRLGLAGASLPIQGALQPCWTSRASIFPPAPRTQLCPPALADRPAPSHSAPLSPCLTTSSCPWVRKGRVRKGRLSCGRAMGTWPWAPWGESVESWGGPRPGSPDGAVEGPARSCGAEAGQFLYPLQLLEPRRQHQALPEPLPGLLPGLQSTAGITLCALGPSGTCRPAAYSLALPGRQVPFCPQVADEAIEAANSWWPACPEPHCPPAKAESKGAGRTVRRAWEQHLPQLPVWGYPVLHVHRQSHRRKALAWRAWRLVHLPAPGTGHSRASPARAASCALCFLCPHPPTHTVVQQSPGPPASFWFPLRGGEYGSRSRRAGAAVEQPWSAAARVRTGGQGWLRPGQCAPTGGRSCSGPPPR